MDTNLTHLVADASYPRVTALIKPRAEFIEKHPVESSSHTHLSCNEDVPTSLYQLLIAFSHLLSLSFSSNVDSYTCLSRLPILMGKLFGKTTA
ncbi:hypothetical protein LXL04_030321 [Taraxacum kok-saghyz]